MWSSQIQLPDTLILVYLPSTLILRDPQWVRNTQDGNLSPRTTELQSIRCVQDSSITKTEHEEHSSVSHILPKLLTTVLNSCEQFSWIQTRTPPPPATSITSTSYHSLQSTELLTDSLTLDRHSPSFAQDLIEISTAKWNSILDSVVTLTSAYHS